MTNQNDGDVTAELINAKLKELGSEFIAGMDIPRTWATGAQAFVSGDFTMIVFREQLLLPEPPPATGLFATMKNVASMIIPTPVVVEFYQNLGAALRQQGMIEGDSDGADHK